MNSKNKIDIIFGDYDLDGDEFLAQNTKIRITTMIDQNVLVALKDIAEKKEIGYQTLINSVLKKFVQLPSSSAKENLNLSEARIRKIVREELKKAR